MKKTIFWLTQVDGLGPRAYAIYWKLVDLKVPAALLLAYGTLPMRNL